MDISIIIVSYNTKEFLVHCLQSIVEHVSKDISYEVIVVDNHSSDGSVEAIKNEKIGIKILKIIENRENVGFSKANNIGIKQAKGAYLLFLNSDTVVPQNTIEEMFVFMEQHTKAGAATCKVCLIDNRLDDACHRGFPTPWNAFCYFSGIAKIFPRVKLFTGYNLSYMNLENTHEIDACAGAFMMVRREAGEQIGWWDEDYFFYGEDLDFCFMLKQNGWKIYYIPTVSILHYKGVSGGIKQISKQITPASKKTKLRATQARFNAMKIFYEKHYKDRYPAIIRWLVMRGIDIKLFFAKNSL